MSAQAQIAVTSEMPESFFERGLAHSIPRFRAGALPFLGCGLRVAGGDRTAARHREEVASEMSREEIAAALRAAREWISHH